LNDGWRVSPLPAIGIALVTARRKLVHASPVPAGGKAIMYLAGGLVLLIIGVAMVWLAKPNKEGQNPAFVRNAFMAMLWPVACLVVLTASTAGILRGFGLV
jgi:hypothetical protein